MCEIVRCITFFPWAQAPNTRLTQDAPGYYTCVYTSGTDNFCRHLPSHITCFKMPSHSLLIIGCGSIGERHLRCFKQTGRTSVSACDTNVHLLTKVAETYQVGQLTDWEAAAQSGDYDSAVIATPAHLHVPIAIELLKRKLHVLIEKPLSHSLRDIETLIACRDRAQRQVAVAYVYHVFPFLTAPSRFIKGGTFGPILHATVTSGQPFHRLRPGYAQTYYRDRAKGGGAIQDGLTHLANWIESIIGPTDNVFCDCAHLALPDVDVEDTVNILARHGNVLVAYAVNQFQAPNETTIQFNAANGSLKIELHNQRWGIFHSGDTDWTWHSTTNQPRDSYFIAQANGFIDQIEGHAGPICSLEAAAKTLRFNLAAIESAKQGIRVDCSSLNAQF